MIAENEPNVYEHQFEDRVKELAELGVNPITPEQRMELIGVSDIFFDKSDIIDQEQMAGLAIVEAELPFIKEANDNNTEHKRPFVLVQMDGAIPSISGGMRVLTDYGIQPIVIYLHVRGNGDRDNVGDPKVKRGLDDEQRKMIQGCRGYYWDEGNDQGDTFRATDRHVEIRTNEPLVEYSGTEDDLEAIAAIEELLKASSKMPSGSDSYGRAAYFVEEAIRTLESTLSDEFERTETILEPIQSLRGVFLWDKGTDDDVREKPEKFVHIGANVMTQWQTGNGFDAEDEIGRFDPVLGTTIVD